MLDKDSKHQLAPTEDHRGYDNIVLDGNLGNGVRDVCENKSPMDNERRSSSTLPQKCNQVKGDDKGEDHPPDDNVSQRVVISVGAEEFCGDKVIVVNGDDEGESDSGGVNNPTFNISDEQEDLSDKGTVSSADTEIAGQESEETQLNCNSHYLVNGNGKILNNCTNEMEIPIPDDAVINYNTGRVRAKKKNSSKNHDSFSEEKIPIEQVEMNVSIIHDTSDKAQEALYNESYAQNGGHLVDGEVKTISVGIPVPSPLTSEKLIQQSNGKPFEEYFIPANTHKKFLRGEKLYLTKDKRAACTSWRRVIMCGVIILIVAIAVLVGALAATGILLAERNSTQRSIPVENISELPGRDSISGNAPYSPNAMSQTPAARGSSMLPAKPSVIMPFTETTTMPSPTKPDLNVPDMSPAVNEINQTVPASVTVPNLIAGELRLLDLQFSEMLKNSSSEVYIKLVRDLESKLTDILQERWPNMNLTIQEFRSGSVIVSFVVTWKSEDVTISKNEIESVIRSYLEKNNHKIGGHQADPNSVKAYAVVDQCSINNGGCSHDCSWDAMALSRKCSCPPGLRLKEDRRSCTSEKSAWTTSVYPGPTSTTTSSSLPLTQSPPPVASPEMLPTQVMYEEFEPTSFQTHTSNNISETEGIHSMTEDFTKHLVTTIESNSATSVVDEFSKFEPTTGEHNALTSLPPYPGTIDSNDVNKNMTEDTFPVEVSVTEQRPFNTTQDSAMSNGTGSFTDSEVPTVTVMDDVTTTTLATTNVPMDPEITENFEDTTTSSPEAETVITPSNESAFLSTEFEATLMPVTDVTTLFETKDTTTMVPPLIQNTNNETETTWEDSSTMTTTATATESILETTTVSSSTANPIKEEPTSTLIPKNVDAEIGTTLAPEESTAETSVPNKEIATVTAPSNVVNMDASTTENDNNTSTEEAIPEIALEVTKSVDELTAPIPVTSIQPEVDNNMTTTVSSTTMTDVMIVTEGTNTEKSNDQPESYVTGMLPETYENKTESSAESITDSINTTTTPIQTTIEPSDTKHEDVTTGGPSIVDTETTTMQSFSITINNGQDSDAINTTEETVTHSTISLNSTSTDNLQDVTTSSSFTTSAEYVTLSSEISSTEASNPPSENKTLADNSETKTEPSYESTTPNLTNEITTTEAIMSVPSTIIPSENILRTEAPVSDFSTTKPEEETQTENPDVTTVSREVESLNAEINNSTMFDGTETEENTTAVPSLEDQQTDIPNVSTVTGLNSTDNFTSNPIPETFITPLSAENDTMYDTMLIDLSNVTDSIDDVNETTTEFTTSSAVLGGKLSTLVESTTVSPDDETTTAYTLDGMNMTTPPDDCNTDEFKCPDEKICRSNYLLCDGLPDCPDGFDEKNCEENCQLNFKCSNSTCITIKARCDGIYDCEDGSDEQNCSRECEQHEVTCKDKSACIKPIDICNDVYNCADRSDEVGCVDRTTCESLGKFFCGDGLCIPSALRCDGYEDCSTDEANCTCESNQFQCLNGYCIPETQRCDGKINCSDSSDEMGCVRVDSEGVVQVYDSGNNTWALLCNQDWERNEADRVCQELGFSGAVHASNIDVAPNVTSWVVRMSNGSTPNKTSLYTTGLAFTDTCTTLQAATVKCEMFECGTKKHSLSRRRKRIVDAPFSQPARWPSLAMIYNYSSSQEVNRTQSSQGCHAVIITPLWLVSSADCLEKISQEATQWYVRIQNEEEHKAEMGLYQQKSAQKPFIHPHSSLFRSQILRDYDIALVRLVEPLDLKNAHLDAICLPAEEVRPGITCFVGAFTKQLTEERSFSVGYVDLQILDRTQCNDGSHYNGSVNNRMLCTHNSGARGNLCTNDEGSPLMCLSPKEEWYLAGLLSYQRFCGKYYQHPEVFSNLYGMLDFVHKVTGQTLYNVAYDPSLYTIQENIITTTIETTTTEITTFETNATVSTSELTTEMTREVTTTGMTAELTATQENLDKMTDSEIISTIESDVLVSEMATVSDVQTPMTDSNSTMAAILSMNTTDENMTDVPLSTDSNNFTMPLLDKKFNESETTDLDQNEFTTENDTLLLVDGEIAPSNASSSDNSSKVEETHPELTTEIPSAISENKTVSETIKGELPAVTVDEDDEVSNGNAAKLISHQNGTQSDAPPLHMPPTESTESSAELGEATLTTISSLLTTNLNQDDFKLENPKLEQLGTDDLSTEHSVVSTTTPSSVTVEHAALNKEEMLEAQPTTASDIHDRMVNDNPVIHHGDQDDALRDQNSKAILANDHEDSTDKNAKHDETDDYSTNLDETATYNKTESELIRELVNNTSDPKKIPKTVDGDLETQLFGKNEDAMTSTSTVSPTTTFQTQKLEITDQMNLQEDTTTSDESYPPSRLRVTAESVFDMTTISEAMLDRILKLAISSRPETEENVMSTTTAPPPLRQYLENNNQPELFYVNKGSLNQKRKVDREEIDCPSGLTCHTEFGRRCISIGKICDLVADCIDASDELDCDPCYPNFNCSSGQCVLRENVCDGIQDCPNGEDEDTCDIFSCNAEEFRCGMNGPCISRSRVCDGYADCDNHTDEISCVSSCDAEHFWCPEGWCIPKSWKCNGVLECLQGDDERDCDCKPDEHRCDNGGCVQASSLCDGVWNCPDGSDEWNCVRLVNETGLIEAYHSDQGWLPLCSDNWQNTWSDMICNQLGYAGAHETENIALNSSDIMVSPSLFFLRDTASNDNSTSKQLQKYLEVRNTTECKRGSAMAISCAEYSCGTWSLVNQESLREIFGDEKLANDVPWPSVGLLEHVDSRSICTASVITPLFVITSLQCILKDDPFLKHSWRYIGTGNPSKSLVQEISVTSIIPHPGAKHYKMLASHDLALAKLQQPLQLDRYFSATCLPKNEIQPHHMCVTVGYTKNNDTDENGDWGLHYLRVPALPKEQCNRSNHYNGFLRDAIICADVENRQLGECEEHSGDALMCANENGQWELHGVLSSPRNCSHARLPLTFNSIYIDSYWIKSVTGDSVMSVRDI